MLNLPYDCLHYRSLLIQKPDASCTLIPRSRDFNYPELLNRRELFSSITRSILQVAFFVARVKTGGNIHWNEKIFTKPVCSQFRLCYDQKQHFTMFLQSARREERSKRNETPNGTCFNPKVYFWILGSFFFGRFFVVFLTVA